MLIIRFLRTGKKNQPFFRIVITDKRNPPRGGRFLEKLGFYNPLTKERGIKAERIKYWLEKGAQVSDSVYNLLISEKIIKGKKKPVHKKSKKKIETPKSEISVEVKAGTGAGVEAEAGVEAKAEVEEGAGVKTKAGTETEAEAKAKAGTEAKPEAGAETGEEVKAGAEVGAEEGAKAEAGVEEKKKSKKDEEIKEE